MSHSPCDCCGYPLPSVAGGVVCPECGADAARRAGASKRRHFYVHALITYIVLVAPAMLSLVTLVAGWSLAYFVIGITNPHWVQHGEHASLDLLGGLLHLSLAASFVTLPIAALLLPVVIIGRYRLLKSRQGSPRGMVRFALCLSLPILTSAAVCTPIPGVTPAPLIRNLWAWIPD